MILRKSKQNGGGEYQLYRQYGITCSLSPSSHSPLTLFFVSLESFSSTAMSASSVPKMDGVSRSHIPSQVALRSDSNMNQSKDTLLHQIRYALANATEERVLIFETVPIETAHSTATELDRLAEGKYR